MRNTQWTNTVVAPIKNKVKQEQKERSGRE